MVKFEGVPPQLLYVGVTIRFPEIVEFVLFTGACHGDIDPTPFAANPISGLLFVHANVEPTGLLTNAAGLI